MRLLYITKLSDEKANGVTVAVTQLLNSIVDYATIGWLDLSGCKYAIDERITLLNSENYLEFKPDIAIFEDPFNSLHFCIIAKKEEFNPVYTGSSLLFP